MNPVSQTDLVSQAVRKTLNPQEVHDVASKLMAMGYTPATVRRRLAEQGIRWHYTFKRHSGVKSRLRRLKAQGMGLCSNCHEKPYLLDSPVTVCPDCLESKWQGNGPIDLTQE